MLKFGCQFVYLRVLANYKLNGDFICLKASILEPNDHLLRIYATNRIMVFPEFMTPSLSIRSTLIFKICFTGDT